MLQNSIKIALRNMFRNKLFSGINIAGLAAGLATCLLIMLYIVDENKYDKHHQDVEQLFRVASVSGVNNAPESWAAASAPLAEAMQNELPEVKYAARLLSFSDIATMLMSYEHNGRARSFFESHGFYADATFFQLFTYDFKFGNAGSALARPNSLVISDELASRYFDHANPVGKIITVHTPFGPLPYTVTGVFYSEHYKSHIPAQYFLSMHNNDMWNWVQHQTSWANNSVFFTYIKLKASADVARFQKKLNEFFDRHAGDEIKAAGFSKSLFLQPVKDIHLHSSIGNEIAVNGSITYLYILSSIGIFILLIACINFMNLSTARSQTRAKEVGVRKVLGGGHRSLVFQFLCESFLLCLIALVIGVALARLMLPVLNSVTQKNIQFFNAPSSLGTIALLALVTGLLAGLYPAFYLSAFKPIDTLKGKTIRSMPAASIRKGLVVFQFTISVCLILGAIIVLRQINLLDHQSLGFRKEQQLVIPLGKSYKNSEKDFDNLQNELQKAPGIASISSGSSYPGIPNLSDMLFYAEGKTIRDVVDVNLSTINNGYIETLGFSILSGRSFSKAFAADSSAIILNETAVKQLGYSVADAPGRNIQFEQNGQLHRLQVVGVVKDFNFESLHKKIAPFGFTKDLFGNKYGFLVARIKTNEYSSVIKQTAKAWAAFFPNIPFEYSFIDKDFQHNYEQERKTAAVIIAFTLVAVLIACLGLFGLATFSAEQRIREIGIRKVLGASVGGIARLLSTDFIKLVLLSLLIAFPVSWYGMHKWLERFAYKASISWWLFAVAGGAAIAIALVTVSAQAIKAAVANPVKSLRTE